MSSSNHTDNLMFHQFPKGHRKDAYRGRRLKSHVAHVVAQMWRHFMFCVIPHILYGIYYRFTVLHKIRIIYVCHNRHVLKEKKRIEEMEEVKWQCVSLANLGLSTAFVCLAVIRYYVWLLDFRFVVVFARFITSGLFVLNCCFYFLYSGFMERELEINSSSHSEFVCNFLFFLGSMASLVNSRRMYSLLAL